MPTYCTATSWEQAYVEIRPAKEALTVALFRACGEAVLDAVAGRHAGAYLARCASLHGLEVASYLG